MSGGEPVPDHPVVALRHRHCLQPAAHRRGHPAAALIDLIGAGGPLALGLYQLTPQAVLGEEGMALHMMNRLPQMATGALVLVGAPGALLTPENLMFYLKEAGLLLINHPGLRADVEVSGLFVLAASSLLLLLPPLAWIASCGSI